jgi:FkbM family methyltransferase
MPLLNTRQKIALAKLAHRAVKLARGALGRPMRDRFQRGGLAWELDLKEGIDFSIFLFGAFEPEVVRCYSALLQPGSVAIDIGANVGAHTLPLARAVGENGRVFAFEPTAYAFAKLNANLALNPALQPRVQASQTLLTDAAGDVKVPAEICSGWPLEAGENLHPEHLGEPHSTAGATSATLDEALASAERVDFIKLDVDGHELSVLRGARGVLARFHPPILIELCPHVCVEHGYPFAALVEELTGAGYRFQRFDGSALPSDTAALEKHIPRNGSINVLAVHSAA